MRPHAGHGRAEAPHLATHDGRVDDQERSGVFLACRLAHDLEVEADLGVRVEELLLRLLPSYCVLSYSSDTTRRAIAHISKSPKSRSNGPRFQEYPERKLRTRDTSSPDFS